MASDEKDKLSMREVAVLAGVSHQTVSRVLNGHQSVKPETRERVLKVIDEVNYRPNLAARALATSKSNRIGVLVDSAVEFGPNSTLRAVEDAARAAQYSVSSITVEADGAEDSRVAVDHLIAQGIDALCIVAPRSSSIDLLRVSPPDIPTLVIKAAQDPTFLTVSVDQKQGATLAVRHLLELGHEEILHVAGPLDWLDAHGREIGWRTEMERVGMAVQPPVVGNWTSDFGYEFGRSFDGLPKFTAVFASNDQMALGIIHGLHECGIRVPEDVSVVGFDDLPDARHFLPPLTTVRQDFRSLGVRSVETLLAVLEGREAVRRSLIQPALIVRESTAVPRS